MVGPTSEIWFDVLRKDSKAGYAINGGEVSMQILV
jgi:hypothetical protein